jgi:hypothetical protein
MNFQVDQSNFGSEFCVQDFGWVKSSPSPNWTTLEESRVIDVSHLELETVVPNIYYII